MSPLCVVGRVLSCNPGLCISLRCTRGSPPRRAACEAGPLFLSQTEGSLTLAQSHHTSGLRGDGCLAT